jgi:hypothetical protein
MAAPGNATSPFCRTVRWHSSGDSLGPHLENLFLDKYILHLLEDFDSSLIKITMTNKLLPTYRDSAIYQILLDMTGLLPRSLHMIIHGFVFEIYKTGS